MKRIMASAAVLLLAGIGGAQASDILVGQKLLNFGQLAKNEVSVKHGIWNESEIAATNLGNIVGVEAAYGPQNHSALYAIEQLAKDVGQKAVNHVWAGGDIRNSAISATNAVNVAEFDLTDKAAKANVDVVQDVNRVGQLAVNHVGTNGDIGGSTIKAINLGNIVSVTTGATY